MSSTGERRRYRSTGRSRSRHHQQHGIEPDERQATLVLDHLVVGGQVLHRLAGVREGARYVVGAVHPEDLHGSVTGVTEGITIPAVTYVVSSASSGVISPAISTSAVPASSVTCSSQLCVCSGAPVPTG